MANLARGPQGGEGAGRFRERNLWVGPVDLVEVDVVRAEPLQARVDAAADPVGARVTLDPAAGHGAEAALDGNHHLVPGPSLQRLRQQALRSAEAVCLSSVKEV